MLIVILALPAVAADSWEQTLERVTQSVVSIRMDRPRAFEGNGRSNSQATGFVVGDGLILTNRHVVTLAPVIAKAVFLDQEEVDLVPIYRDPVHDFGLFRFDPSDLHFQEAPPLQIEPTHARVGVPIRVVGNDAGEQISILDGTLARLDRGAPKYGSGYNDFNTFYIQAASSTSGGSSGSPVIDSHGHVVALNAGGNRSSASSFYLPLQRVVRAVELVQAGKPIPRGTLQTRFVYEPYDELRRLGLDETTEAAARKANPEGIGMLVAREVLPEGPAFRAIQIGDVLLDVGGEPVLDFVALERILDDAVGRPLPVTVERAGERLSLQVTVGDLHAIVPDRYIEIGGAVLHDLSYHHARVQQIPVLGVHVADTGFTLDRDGMREGSVILFADDRPTPNLEALEEVLRNVPDGGSVNVRFFHTSQPQELQIMSLRIDRDWFPARSCSRDDTTGQWPCEDWPEVGEASRKPPARIAPMTSPDKRFQHVAEAIVRVDCDLPYRVAGAPTDNYVGGGVVLDAEKGLVLVDRDTVPSTMGDIELTFAGVVRAPARVAALHPEHSVALVQYDPAALAGVTISEVPLADASPDVGDTAWHVSVQGNGQVKVQELAFQGPSPLLLPLDGPPRFRESNLDILETEPSIFAPNGPLVDKRGRVVGFQASMSYHSDREPKARWGAVPVETIRELLVLASGEKLRTLGWEILRIPLPFALERGLPPEEAEAIVAHDPVRRGVLTVARLERGSTVDDVLQLGDMLLDIDGNRVTSPSEVDDAIRHADEVTLRIFRGGISEVTIATSAMSTTDIDRVVLWAGLRIHMPHRGARFGGIAPDRPYIAWRNGGSPAGRSGIYAIRSIESVNGTQVYDLDGLLEVLTAAPDGTAVRLEMVDDDGEREVRTVEPDTRFWPTEELLLGDDGKWARQPVLRPAAIEE